MVVAHPPALSKATSREGVVNQGGTTKRRLSSLTEVYSVEGVFVLCIEKGEVFMKKKILALTLACAATLSLLAGCGGFSGTNRVKWMRALLARAEIKSLK